MRVRVLLAVAVFAAGIAANPIGARAAFPNDIAALGGGASTLPPYLQCVPYARQVSGIQIYGDAWTWWSQARGRYARGYLPRIGAVMALRPHGNSRLGHVAAVSRILDARTILVRHANWSPIDGRRGQIEDNVKVIDVSPTNDWSEVRIWYAPIGALGGSHWPVQGFIYPVKPGSGEVTARSAAPKPAAMAKSAAKRRSKDPIADIIGAKMGW
ncbi:CHAP domain-containing protein [Novosphingobium sp.]|uniref:CHAP domain-containing protein n=1 Tax=Novosphingobium sp. TaxID=1874826 RepID=UPI00286CC73D|nr:CHAP domain-containing protein [Novosphingobium sp.]